MISQPPISTDRPPLRHGALTLQLGGRLRSSENRHVMVINDRDPRDEHSSGDSWIFFSHVVTSTPAKTIHNQWEILKN